MWRACRLWPDAVALVVARIIYFTRRLDVMTAFYRDGLGLDLIGEEDGWREFRAGACIIALHKGPAAKPGRSPKLAFYVADVAAEKLALEARGVVMGKIWTSPQVTFCDGHDPDGNAFSISDRELA